MTRPRLRLLLALLMVPAAAALARAASPDDSPPESHAQGDAALKAIAPAYASKIRHPDAGEPGTIEHAILAHVPTRFHPVDEGKLPPVVVGARCPSDMASVDGRFCVDRYEGSIVVRGEAGDAGDAGADQPWSPFVPPPDDRPFAARSVPDVIPQGYISAAQAEKACSAVHKRLCQAVEWRAACGGSQGWAYPYGPTHVADKCHDTGVAPMLVFHAAEMKKGWGPIELNDPRLNQLEGTLAKTGAFAGCVNDYGAHDMVGNLHEWTADPHGTFQGGYYLDTTQHGEACAYRTVAHDYTYHDYSTGFRCCAAPGSAP